MSILDEDEFYTPIKIADLASDNKSWILKLLNDEYSAQKTSNISNLPRTGQDGGYTTLTSSTNGLNILVKNISNTPTYSMQKILLEHHFDTINSFPTLTERVNLKNTADFNSYQGIDGDDLSVAYETTATIKFVASNASYKSSLGHYRIGENGVIEAVKMDFTNLKDVQAGTEQTIQLAGERGADFGFFIIADGFNKNKSYAGMNFKVGTLEFIYHYGKSDARKATIYDKASDISLVHDYGGKIKLVVKGDMYHTTANGGSQELNADGQNHVVSGLTTPGDTTSLRIGFEDLKNLGDADFNDVVFDLKIGGQEIDALMGTNTMDTISGTVGDDIIVGLDGNDTFINTVGSNMYVGGNGYDTIDYSNALASVIANLHIDKAETNGLGGIDYFDEVENLIGSAYNDNLTGTNGINTIYGGAGNDTINGYMGKDTLFGDAGDDELMGGDGDDTLSGGEGNDVLTGNEGNDIIHGDGGNDILHANSGNDLLYGDDGDDLIYGDRGTNTLDAGAGDDNVFGGIDSDTIYGGDGNDLLQGGTGNDTIYADAGDDTLYGGGGDDLVIGGAGNDVLEGGDGADIFKLTTMDGKDQIRDFNFGQGDTLDITDLLNGYQEGTSDIADFVRIRLWNSNRVDVQISEDGTGSGYQIAATVWGADFTGQNAQALLNSGVLVVDETVV